MVITFLSAFLISLLTLIIVVHLSHKHEKFMDFSHQKKPQNFHDECTPRSGGFGIITGMLIFLMTSLGIKLILPALLAFLSGIFEDFHNSLSVRRRLILQAIAALIAVFFLDAVVTYLGLGISMPYWFGIVFSVFAIVGMMNAINIIDGFNGLASGAVLLILISFAITSYQLNNLEMLSVIMVVLGSTFGLFILVFPKGKIFLGDGGAYLLGFIVAIIGIFLASKYAGVSPWYILATFIYPVFEVIFSIIRKLSIGLSPMKPDAYHFHMLVYRGAANRNNPLTTFIILLFITPFMVTSTIYANCSICNLNVVITFIFCYVSFYIYLYKKDLSKKL